MGDSLEKDDSYFINEDDIEAFANALDYEPDLKSGSSSSVTLNTQKLAGESRPDLITSKSDWIPIYKRLKKPREKLHRVKSKKKINNEVRSSLSYHLLRWPILFFTLSWISFLCVVYSIIRVYVALYEYFLTWRGERRRLREIMRNSKTYEEWVKNAKALDDYLGFTKWQKEPKFYYYDYKTIELTVRKLRNLRKAGKFEELSIVLQGCIKSNFAGIENPQLYSQCYYGTKDLVEKYIDEVVASLEFIIDSDQMAIQDKRKLFSIMSKNYGRTALCLSGGATFAYSHFGIIKAFLDEDLLPDIISGTSGGGLVAALACTRTNDELKKLLVPQLAAKITACEEPFSVWIRRWWNTGARFDAVDWAQKSSFFTYGSLTFEESYKRTGRKLNISTVPADPHSPVILCNTITSPNCVIWSSLLASSAVPGILNPVVLMVKDKSGEVVPFSFGNKWRDGSLRTDIPVESLNTYFNVKFSVVSQVNPHISLFFYAPKGSVGRPVSRRSKTTNFAAGLRGGFIGSALEHLVKLEIRKWLTLIKSLDLFPHLLDQDWSNVWLQRFSGTITLWPKIKLTDFWYILSDPTEERLSSMIRKGEICAYPKLLFVKHRLTIERMIARGKKISRVNGLLDPSFTRDSTPHMMSDNSGNGFGIETVDYSSDSEDEISDNNVYQRRNGNILNGSRTGFFFASDDDKEDLDYVPSEFEATDGEEDTEIEDLDVVSDLLREQNDDDMK